MLTTSPSGSRATAITAAPTRVAIASGRPAGAPTASHDAVSKPGRVSATALRNPDFAALARAYGCWGDTVERTEDFRRALTRAMVQPGVKLLHLRTEVEAITARTTLSAIAAR